MIPSNQTNKQILQRFMRLPKVNRQAVYKSLYAYGPNNIRDIFGADSDKASHKIFAKYIMSRGYKQQLQEKIDHQHDIIHNRVPEHLKYAQYA